MSRQSFTDTDQARAFTRPLEEYLTALRKGAWLLKHGRFGKPKLHYFRLVSNDTQLAWRSANGQRRLVDLVKVLEVRRGQNTDVFKRNQQTSVAELSFSLIYSCSQGESRSLDLICPGEDAFSLWFGGIKALIATNPALKPPPAYASRAVPGAQLPPKVPTSAADGPAAIYQRTSQAQAPILVNSGIVNSNGVAASRVSGDIGFPMRTRTPGDLWVWGSSAGLACSAEGEGKDKKAVACFPQPHLVPETKQLDVLKVAVGSRHAALVTYAGDLYTWGDGAGGKLGHGTQEDIPQPLRLATLWGSRVTSVRCSSATTACITDAEELWTWGDNAGGLLGYSAIRQYIPRRVDLPAVTQVSLGPYHAAAITKCGRLFTWGDGLAHRLGHGDTRSVAQPRQVEALGHLHAIRVACGYWHTVAIAGQIEAETSEAEGYYMGHGPDFGHITSASGKTGLMPIYGWVYTWGGMLSPTAASKKDTHKGCLGTGDLQGRKLPTQVFDGERAKLIAAGLNFTVVVSSQHKVFQAGELVPNKSVKWSSCTSFEAVGGGLERCWVDELSAGAQHCAATARQVDLRNGISFPIGPRMVYTWGKGQDGQLGTGSRVESSIPVQVQGLQGKKVLQVSCGANYAMAVCEHNMRSEDVEELAMLQEAKDFFKQRFNKNIEALTYGMSVTVQQSGTSRILPKSANTNSAFATASTAVSSSFNQAPSSVTGSDGSRVQMNISPSYRDMSARPTESLDSFDMDSQSMSSHGGEGVRPSVAGNKVSRSMASFANKLNDMKKRGTKSKAQNTGRPQLAQEHEASGNSHAAADENASAYVKIKLTAGLLPPSGRINDSYASQRADSALRRPSPHEWGKAQSTNNLRSVSHGGDSAKAPPNLRRFASLNDGALGPRRVSDSNISLHDSMNDMLSDQPSSSGNMPMDPPPLLPPPPQLAHSPDALLMNAAVDLRQSGARVAALEARVAKLEALLAQRTAQNDALTHQLTLLGKDPGMPMLVPGTSTASMLAHTPAKQDQDEHRLPFAAVQQQQAMVMRRLQEAADKEAAVQRKEAELERRATALQENGVPLLAGKSSVEVPKAAATAGPQATGGAQLAAERHAPLYIGPHSFALTPTSLVLSEADDTSEGPSTEPHRAPASSKSTPFASPAASTRELASLLSAPSLTGVTMSDSPSHESPFLAYSASSVQDVNGGDELESSATSRPTVPAVADGGDVDRPTSRRGHVLSPAASRETPLELTVSPSIAAVMVGGRNGMDGTQQTERRRDLGETWTEEIDQGVYLNFEVKERGPQLTRIRFSRRHFSKEQAEKWYQQNRQRIVDQFSRTLLGGAAQLDNILKGSAKLPGQLRIDNTMMVADVAVPGGNRQGKADVAADRPGKS